jgi:hypothetical protein
MKPIILINQSPVVKSRMITVPIGNHESIMNPHDTNRLPINRESIINRESVMGSRCQ